MEQSSECIQKYELKLALLSTYGKPAFPLRGGSSINKSRWQGNHVSIKAVDGPCITDKFINIVQLLDIDCCKCGMLLEKVEEAIAKTCPTKW